MQPNAKRARSSSLAEGNDRDEHESTARISNGLLATPHPAKRKDGNDNDLGASSPLLAPPSSSSIVSRLAPTTPLNVTELKKGKHEIVGVLRQKIVFSKRPEPVVKLDLENGEDGG